ncbi:MAG: HU family DNA-binding protein [Pseudomonadota bacterium]
MKKSELVAYIKEQNPNFDEDQVVSAVEAIFECIGGALSEGKRVEIRGFGAFSVKGKPERMGRNPRTGEPVKIEAKNVVHFKPGKDLKQSVNQEAA